MRDVNIPELLAPVGGWQQLRAAVQNGADAIYMGGPLFNARIKAENFTKEDMERAIEYAHDRNVRVYVTINTLIKDSELRDAFSYVNFLYGAAVFSLTSVNIVVRLDVTIPVRRSLIQFSIASKMPSNINESPFYVRTALQVRG